ncbi:hypothetical protein [Polaromonas sp.]|uniref:hypothetical protein n=1 Tax=Polaromonas sp. TaxID=1869339 RepID=UPI0017AB723D|nr:hypothetical protein [Polaromonas sp.]NML85590.1 hypothetical protein [Polaromonas sp.]
MFRLKIQKNGKPNCRLFSRPVRFPVAPPAAVVAISHQGPQRKRHDGQVGDTVISVAWSSVMKPRAQGGMISHRPGAPAVFSFRARGTKIALRATTIIAGSAANAFDRALVLP